MKYGIWVEDGNPDWYFNWKLKRPWVFRSKYAAEKYSEKLRERFPQTKYEVRPYPETKPEVGKESNPKDAIAGGKVPLWLCSPIATAKWALAQFAGLIKYGAWNWRIAGVRSSVYLSAAKRHLDAYISGEELDPVDGTDHLANVMACCAIILDAKAAGKLTDDRPPSVDLRPAYREIESQVAKLRGQYGDMNPRHYTIADTEKQKPQQ